MSKKIPLATFLVGVPASGKSTLARSILANDPRAVRVSRDDFRYMLRGVGWCPKEEELITRMHDESLVAALAAGRNVVVDNTHCRLADLLHGIDVCRHYADVGVTLVPCAVEEAVARDAARERSVGRAVIERMHASLSEWSASFDYAKRDRMPRPAVISSRDERRSAVIFDVDGTLAIMGQRGPFDWSRVGLDAPNMPVVERAREHRSKGDLIIVMSGRDSVCRQETEAWLNEHGVEFDELYMRAQGDREKDSVVKRELFEAHVAGRGLNVLAVYDDRLQVLRMWHSLGLFTFNVNQGNVEF